MSVKTTYYQLEKPDPDDYYDINGYNATMDKIDSALHAHENGIETEKAAREEGDRALGELIDAEEKAREETDERLKQETADREAADEALLTEFLEQAADVDRQLKMLWELLRMNVYDGGIFGTEQTDAPLDGGSFDDTDLTPFDCGGFDGYTIPMVTADDVVDGGTY